MSATTSASGSGMAGSELLRRLSAISEIDQRIGDLMKHAQTCIAELSKEKQISKSKMEEASSAFKRTLNAIESELSAQMQYLSHVCVGTPHQGSTFASQQNVTLAEETILALSDRLMRIQSEHVPSTSDDIPMG
uniref:Mediator of RNA polymerase II transcription subunit 11 n=1 Tax=Ascaris lumbricoides TaxID=6252 RepID=A0A0M3HRY8_ASCLU